MKISRRLFLERAAALGATTLVLACKDGPGTSDDDGLAPDGFPRYAYDGPQGPEDTFAHGVASGDPLSDAVLLWTRLSPGSLGDGPHEVFLEVARDPEFADRVAAETYSTEQARDFTLTVDATGLDAGATYYYRFSALGRTSAVGRTRTTPTGQVGRVRFGVCSCSNYGFGYFHAYRHMAQRPDLDVVLHLGDYIYEHASVGYGFAYGGTRELEPRHEIVSLDDYRQRYALYRTDPDLQELHRQAPFVHVWDDHEFADNPEVGGAVNHEPEEEGPWSERVDHAIAAYLEWMPTRVRDEDRIYRTLDFGDLARLVVLDRQRRFLWPEEDDDHYLGREQADWLDARIAETDAQWLLLGQGSRFGSREADGVGGSSWDPASRQRTLDAVADAGIDDLVVLTGDIHKFEALDIVDDAGVYDPQTGAGSAGVELVAGSITSPGTNSDTEGVPQFFWSEHTFRGYLVLDLTPERLQADFYGFEDSEKYEESLPDEVLLEAYIVAAGTRHLVETDSAVPTREDAPPLAP